MALIDITKKAIEPPPEERVERLVEGELLSLLGPEWKWLTVERNPDGETLVEAKNVRTGEIRHFRHER